MKICPKCGVTQSDKRTSCVDCGTRLEDPVSKEIEAKLQAEGEQKLEKLYNKRDPLHRNPFDIVLGCIMAAELVAVIVMSVLYGELYRDVEYLFCGWLFPLIGVIEAFFPKIGWELEKLRMSFSANGADDLTPSDFYLIMRKVGHMVWALLGGLILYAMIELVANPPAYSITDTENIERLIASMVQ